MDSLYGYVFHHYRKKVSWWLLYQLTILETMRHTTVSYEIYLCSLEIKKWTTFAKHIKTSNSKSNINWLKLLTNAKLYTTTTIIKAKISGWTNCGTCANLMEGSEFKQEKEHTVKINFTYASGNLIYVITYSGCGHNYIGNTCMTMRWRTILNEEHLSHDTERLPWRNT